jgi:hypothetical protein
MSERIDAQQGIEYAVSMATVDQANQQEST